MTTWTDQEAVAGGKGRSGGSPGACDGRSHCVGASSSAFSPNWYTPRGLVG